MSIGVGRIFESVCLSVSLSVCLSVCLSAAQFKNERSQIKCSNLIPCDILEVTWLVDIYGRFWITLHSMTPRPHYSTSPNPNPNPSCTQRPRRPYTGLPMSAAPARRSINIDANCTPIHHTPLPAAKRAATRRPPRPLNLIPRRGRPLHRVPLRSSRHLKLTRRPAIIPASATNYLTRRRRPALPAAKRAAINLPVPRRLLPAPLTQRPGRL